MIVRDRITQNIDFGHLTGLIGTWDGSNGYNMISVPDQKGEFQLLVAPYTETLVVNAVQATTPNRGLQTIAQIPTLQYSTTIWDLSPLAGVQRARTFRNGDQQPSFRTVC